MKTAYRKDLGHILLETVTGKRLIGLTAVDARDLMFGHMTSDRRRSFTNVKNRAWADGVQW